MTNFRIPVEPDTYFVDHAEGNRVSTQVDRVSVKLTPALAQWIDYARQDIPDRRETKTHMASLAVEFGADRPMIGWGLPVGRFGEIAHRIIENRMNGETPGLGVPQMDMSWEPRTNDVPGHVRMEPDTRDLVDLYASLLQIRQSQAMRCCVAISFRWYNADVFHGEKAEEMNRQTQEYVRRFKQELELRVEYARDVLDMEV